MVKKKKKQDKYPEVNRVYQLRQRPIEDGSFECANCKRWIYPYDNYAPVEIRVSIFRGDDEFACVCEECSKQKLDAAKLLKAKA